MRAQKTNDTYQFDPHTYEPNLPGFFYSPKPDRELIHKAVGMLNQSERPIIICGHGVIMAGNWISTGVSGAKWRGLDLRHWRSSVRGRNHRERNYRGQILNREVNRSKVLLNRGLPVLYCRLLTDYWSLVATRFNKKDLLGVLSEAGGWVRWRKTEDR